MNRTDEVTQADREAAGGYLTKYENISYGHMVLAGHRDAHPLVQAFAAHRRATQPDAALREAARELLLLTKAAPEDEYLIAAMENLRSILLDTGAGRGEAEHG